jgi:hypothetical protein
LVAAAAAVAVYLVWSAATDRDYEQVNAGSVIVATILAVVIGGLLFRVIAGRATRPVRAFAILAAVVAVLESAMAAAVGNSEGYDGGFVVLTGLLHVVVAGTAVLLIPRLAGVRDAAGRH